MQPFDGLSILLLEDEFLIAVDAEQTLLRMGASRIKIVNTLPAAFDAVAEGGIDVAILDININGQTSFELARHLIAHGTPVIFASGYGMRKRDVPEAEGAIHLGKPYTAETLCNAVSMAISKRRSAPPPDMVQPLTGTAPIP